MKKKKYEENKGLTGKGIDYSVYRMSLQEKLISISLGAAAGVTAFCIFFGVCIPAAAAGAAGGLAALKAGKNYFKSRRDRELITQFRDFLESVSSSLSAGQNISGAIASAGEDMKQLYGEKSVMACETEIIIDGMRNNITAEELFEDLASRSGQRDIRTFSDTFCVCNRTGGNMREILIRTSGVLSEKMQTEREIDVIVSKGRNELMIMTVMPFIIIPMLKTLGENGVTELNPVTVAVRTAGAVIIALAIMLGRKMTDIRL